MEKEKKIFGNYLLSTLNTILSLLFPLITFPYVSRILGSESLGIVNFAQSYGYYFIHIANFGISSYAVREISKVRHDKKLVEKKANEIYNINFVFSVLAWCAFVIGVFLVPKLRDNWNVLLVYSIIVLTNFLSIEWLLQSFDDYKFATIRSSIIRLISLVATFMLIRSSADYIIYMCIITVCEMGARLSTLRYSNKQYIKLRIKRAFLNFSDHFKSMFTLFSFRLVNGISAQLDKLMLGFMLFFSAVGVYSAGVKLVLMLIPIIENVGIVMFPTINIIANKSEKKYEEAVRLNYNIILFMGIPMSVGLFLISPMTIKLLAGNEYLQAVNVSRIMSLVVLLCPIGDLLGSKTLLIYGKNQQLLICSIIVAMVNIIANCIMIPIGGISGAAVASLLSYIVAIMCRLYYTKKIFRFRLFTGDFIKYVIYTIPFVLIYIPFQRYIDQKFFACFSFVLLCILIYFVELVLFKDQILLLLKKKIFVGK